MGERTHSDWIPPPHGSSGSGSTVCGKVEDAVTLSGCGLSLFWAISCSCFKSVWSGMVVAKRTTARLADLYGASPRGRPGLSAKGEALFGDEGLENDFWEILRRDGVCDRGRELAAKRAAPHRNMLATREPSAVCMQSQRPRSKLQ